ncbi:MAG: RagB/SusD family nutrient uptake outer membrane protein [Bacteroides sp.]|nr:RagB/SusD family nutrient uptake outer membrane protein [Bacteroides sp.]
MKTFNKYIAIALVATTFVGCTDLDTFPESGTVTEEQKGETIVNDPAKAEAGVNAVFAQYSQYLPNYNAIGGSRHNDFGYAALMLMMDTNGHDMPSPYNGYNWASGALDFGSRVYTDPDCIIFWNTLYQQIFVANNVVASIDTETEDPTQQYYLAQALGSRAFAYWVLAQLYQFTYVDSQDKPCVPLITEANAASVATDGCARSTVKEVYEQIMADLNKAVTCMENTTVTKSDKRYLSKASVYGLRARVNLTMQNWAEAAQDADQAINSFAGRPYSRAEVSVPTFWDSNDASWMWAIIIAESDDIVQTGIINWPSHMASLNYGYNSYFGGRQINKALYNTIPATDVRKGWWTNSEGLSDNLNAEQQEYMASCEYGPYTNVKFGPYNNLVGTDVNANDIPLMRIEEMYLIKAEGLAMSGSTPDAKTLLEEFIRTYRDASYTCDTSSSAGLQEEIYRQRRIELWGEGLNWFDLMRLKKDVDRRGAGYTDASLIFHIPAGSDILLYRLPESEIQANQMLSDSDNNPAAEKPTPVDDIE